MQLLDVLDELRVLYSDRQANPLLKRLTDADVQRWSISLGNSRSDLYDRIAIQLAHGFETSELSFTLCDALLNDLFGVITSANESAPSLFWDVYLAFDEGEYRHASNPEQDPVEAYTRPMIARIVGTLRLLQADQFPESEIPCK